MLTKVITQRFLHLAWPGTQFVATKKFLAKWQLQQFLSSSLLVLCL